MLAMYTRLPSLNIYLATLVELMYCSALSVLREVDVSLDPCLTRAIEQADQCRTLQCPGSAAHQDDQSRMGYGFCRLQEVIAVARHQDQTLRAGVTKHRFVAGIYRKRLSQPSDAVAEGLQREHDVIRDVVVQQEFHLASGTIWRATSTSISPRWSS